MSMLTVMKTLQTFGKEKTVVMREQMEKQYSLITYLFAKILAELPVP